MQDLSDILGLKRDPVASGRPTPAPIASPQAELIAEPIPDPSVVSPRHLRRFSLAVVFSLAACATASAPGLSNGPAIQPVLSPNERALAFSLEAPGEDATGPNLRLWATHYHTPEITPAAASISAAFPLIGRDGAPISPPLTHRDWCEAALQGSVSVHTGNTSTAYVFVDANGPDQADCDQWLGSLTDGVKNATRRARFMKVNHPLGCGVRNHPLVPFRTIAVDPTVIPLESVVFVPELRGRAFTYNGRDFVHDGYLFAGDRGGAIKGRHIDVFMNEASSNALEDLFASTDARTFKAHIVDAAAPAAEAIRETQAAPCGAN
jgi:3D (Asp-Asp-Asp) domain-containing protein